MKKVDLDTTKLAQDLSKLSDYLAEMRFHEEALRILVAERQVKSLNMGIIKVKDEKS